MSILLLQELIPQIRRLIHRDHEPIVAKKLSQLKNAGTGVWTTTNVYKGEALCLYPGVYCPGVPPSMVSSDPLHPFPDVVEFLGHHTTPSGIPMDKNAYILNIQTRLGGYIDGMALDLIQGKPISIREYALTHTMYHAQEKTRFDTNPSCCGHMINHSKKYANVRILPFLWTDVAEPVNKIPRFLNHNEKPYYTKKLLSSIPNRIRNDGAPRYLYNGDIVYYNDEDERETGRPPIYKCHGAVIYATKNMMPDQELLLDYGLTEPLPKWAESWYNKVE